MVVVAVVVNFLEIDKFDHDYENIQNVAPEDDRVYGLRGMHDVRKSISKRKINPYEVLSPYVINKYAGLEFWRENG